MFRSSSPDDDVSATPRTSHSPEGPGEDEAERWDEPLHFDWSAFVPLVHPMKTAIIEAMCWVDDPLSANLLSHMTGGRYTLQYVSYHVKTLAEAGLIVQVKRRQVRGATERLYRLNPRLIG